VGNSKPVYSRKYAKLTQTLGSQNTIEWKDMFKTFKHMLSTEFSTPKELVRSTEVSMPYPQFFSSFL
jgi:hypothetical protein